MQPNFITGTLTATGAAMNVQLGFKPKKVLIINETTQIGLEWTDTMSAGKGLKTLQAGTRSFLASGGISQLVGSPGPIALTGTLSVTAGSAAITGAGTRFTSEVKVGDILAVPGVGTTGIGGSATTDQMYIKVIAIASDTALNAQVVSDYTASGKSAFNTSGIADGFTIGIDSINTATNVLHYVAYRTM